MSGLENFMDALATALFTITLALLGKIGFDLWDRYRDRRGIAGAIGGELAAYLDLLNRPDIWADYKAATHLDRVSKIAKFKATPRLPIAFPVFEKLADRLGLLPNSAAVEISRSYIMLSCLCNLNKSISDKSFIESDEEFQNNRLNYIADLMMMEVARSLSLVQFLREVSKQGFMCWIFRCSIYQFN